MLIQALILVLISFSTYILALFLRDLFGNFGFPNGISQFGIPLTLSIAFFIIGITLGINYALFALLPLIPFSNGKDGIIIISALFVSYLSPILGFLLFPPLVYRFIKSKENYSFIKLQPITYLSFPVAIFSIFVGAYFLNLTYASIFLLFAPLTFIFLNFFDRNKTSTNLVPVALTFTLPLLGLITGDQYNPTMVSLGILFSLVPILRCPFWVRG